MKNQEIKFKGQKYSVIIGKNAMDVLPKKIKLLCPKTKKIALIIDQKIPQKFKKKLMFENLTLAPIEKRLINSKKLNNKEKEYLFKYHLNVYLKISKFLNKAEKKWLASFIQ